MSTPQFIQTLLGNCPTLCSFSRSHLEVDFLPTWQRQGAPQCPTRIQRRAEPSPAPGQWDEHGRVRRVTSPCCTAPAPQEGPAGSPAPRPPGGTNDVATWSRAVSTASPPPSALPSGCAHFPPSITDTEGGHVEGVGTAGPPVPAPSVRGGPWGMNVNPTEEPRDSASQCLLLPCMCQQGSVVDLDPTPQICSFFQEGISRARW